MALNGGYCGVTCYCSLKNKQKGLMVQGVAGFRGWGLGLGLVLG